MIQPWNATNKFNEFFPNYKTDSHPTKKITYGAPNDFGRIIHEVLFANAFPNFSDRFFADLQLVSEREGFRVKESRDSFTVRDYAMKTEGSTFITPIVSTKIKEAMERTCFRGMFRNDHGTFITSIVANRGSCLGNVMMDGALLLERIHTLPSEFPNGTRATPIYFEGGNILSVTGRDGKKRILCGEDNAVMTHMILRMEGFFNKMDKNSLFYQRTLKHDTPAKDLYLKEAFAKSYEEMHFKLAVETKADNLNKTLMEMLHMGLIKNYSDKTEKDLFKAMEICYAYLAQKAFVQDTVIPSELKVSKEQMIYLPQISYHLDTMLTAGPDGTLLLQDYEQSVELLKNIQKRVKNPKEIEKMIAVTKKEGETQRQLLQAAKQKLEQEGFTVIPTPGVFYSEGINLTFFNAISGYSSKTKSHYYIVGGTSFNEELAPLLMDAFSLFLKNLSPDVNLYFVGRDPANPLDFSFADNLANNLKSKATGVHCLSIETRIEAAN